MPVRALSPEAAEGEAEAQRCSFFHGTLEDPIPAPSSLGVWHCPSQPLKPFLAHAPTTYSSWTCGHASCRSYCWRQGLGELGPVFPHFLRKGTRAKLCPLAGDCNLVHPSWWVCGSKPLLVSRSTAESLTCGLSTGRDTKRHNLSSETPRLGGVCF